MPNKAVDVTANNLGIYNLNFGQTDMLATAWIWIVSSISHNIFCNNLIILFYSK